MNQAAQRICKMFGDIENQQSLRKQEFDDMLIAANVHRILTDFIENGDIL